MTLEKILGEATSMNRAERKFARKLAAQLEKSFCGADAADSPLLDLRIDDLVASMVLVRREEARLPRMHRQRSEREKAAVLREIALVDAVGKARERMRKALKELEVASAKSGTPAPLGIADQLCSLMRATRGVDLMCMEEVVEPVVDAPANHTPGSASSLSDTIPPSS